MTFPNKGFEVLSVEKKQPTEREVLEDWDFENKKRIVNRAIKQISEQKDVTIIYFEEISKVTTIEEGEVEDLVVLSLADGLLEGDVYFDEEDKGCVKIKSRKYRVKYEEDK